VSVATLAVLVVPFVVLCAGALLLVRIARTAPGPASATPWPVLAWRAAGIVIGMAAAAWVVSGGSLGRGPWPGSYYTVPGLGLVLVGLVLAVLVLHRVVRRPRPAGSAEADDARRGRSAEAVTAATGILVLVPLLGVAATAGVELGDLAGVCGPQWWGPAGTALEVTAGLAFVAAAWCVAVLLTPQRRPVRSFG
jgi:hypothetical protein